jgi:hypothetical protein
MWNFLVNVLSIAYVQVIILFLFLWYFFAHRKDPRLTVSRISLIRISLLVLIFIYFLLSWASGVRPALAEAAVFGMFIINVFMLFSLILARLERPFRDSLGAYCDEPQKIDNLAQVWKTGKRFYYWRHFLSSITSGISPTRFLHEVASGRIRDDIQDCLRSRGATRQFISLQGMLDYLESRLAQDDLLPQDFKDLTRKDLKQFRQHPWIEDQVNEYLRVAMETPENIHNPDWAQMWDKARAGTK